MPTTPCITRPEHATTRHSSSSNNSIFPTPTHSFNNQRSQHRSRLLGRGRPVFSPTNDRSPHLLCNTTPLFPYPPSSSVLSTSPPPPIICTTARTPHPSVHHPSHMHNSAATIQLPWWEEDQDQDRETGTLFFSTFRRKVWYKLKSIL